jgi:Fic family protein
MADVWQSIHWPRFMHDPQRTETALAAFYRRLGRVSGLQEALSPDEQRAAFLRALTGEAVASFAIEGDTLSAPEVEASLAAALAYHNAEPQHRSDAVAELMLEARVGQWALTADRLHRWHALLFHSVELEEKARWRSDEMVIVKSAKGGKEEVLYTAPPPEQVASDMEALLDWLNHEQALPTPIQAALAHLWFESIHPYSDGNGMIGRAIVAHVFAREVATPMPLSRQIEADRRGYYGALQAGRQVSRTGIDGTEFALWFLDRLTIGLAEDEADAQFLVLRNRFFLRFSALSPRAEHVLRQLFAEGPDRVAQGLSAGPYAEMTGVSAATATRDLTELEAKGALVRGQERGRSTRYLLAL